MSQPEPEKKNHPVIALDCELCHHRLADKAMANPTKVVWPTLVCIGGCDCERMLTLVGEDLMLEARWHLARASELLEDADAKGEAERIRTVAEAVMAVRA